MISDVKTGLLYDCIDIEMYLCGDYEWILKSVQVIFVDVHLIWMKVTIKQIPTYLQVIFYFNIACWSVLQK